MIKKCIIALLFISAINAQEDGPGKYEELEKALAATDSEQAKLEIAWQFKKLTTEQRAHLIEVAQEAAQRKKEEISYKYLYRDWYAIGKTASLVWGAYTAGKFAYDKGMEVKAATGAGISISTPAQLVKTVSAVYSAEAALVLAITSVKSLHKILTMESAKAEHWNAIALLRELEERAEEDTIQNDEAPK